jgi:hypothetical protein
MFILLCYRQSCHFAQKSNYKIHFAAELHQFLVVVRTNNSRQSNQIIAAAKVVASLVTGFFQHSQWYAQYNNNPSTMLHHCTNLHITLYRISKHVFIDCVLCFIDCLVFH